ncbi:hypothetical protein O181_090881 [Austropuccinia psidii MF-1]|uniref:Uncharacterized protein n=1 Tax=Austropuccinia psidii MF-1 TaxID=1389203 RepID=A0A9Q3P944_9BASI|nr:hypothetical protein [Austropuccinia psidii MF-1]
MTCWHQACILHSLPSTNKDHERYTNDWVTLLPAVQLAYNTSNNSTTGKNPAVVEKGWNTLLPVDHLKKNLLTIHPTAKDFHDMWKRACDTPAECIAEAKEDNKQGDECSGSQTYIGIFKKAPSLSNKFGQAILQNRGGQIPSTKKKPTPPDIVEVEDSSGPVIRFKNQTADKDKWLAEVAIPDGNLNLRRFSSSRRTEQAHQ